MPDLLIHGCAPDGSRLSLAIEEGCFVAVDDREPAREEIDFGDALLLPSWIDAHVHFNEPGRSEWEGLATGSRALAAGGGTTFIDMPLNSTPPVITAEALLEKRDLAEEKSCLDFALWGGLTPDSLGQLEAMADAGAIGFKAFMCESGIDDFLSAHADVLKSGMEMAAARNLPVAVHAELPHPVSVSGRDMAAWLASRPVAFEMDAIRLALDLAGETGCALHIVHVTHPDAIQLVTEGKRQGVDVTVETCPHYLLLDAAAAIRIGAAAKCAPPLRDSEVVSGLWEKLLSGEIDTIGSDHSPSSPDLKTGDDLFAIWGGIAGIQHGLPLLLSADRGADASSARSLPDALPPAIDRRDVDLPTSIFPTLSSVLSENVARRFRLPGKGGFTRGHDADFIVVEKSETTITAEELLTCHRISPYLGMKSSYRIESTWLRGQRVTADTRGRFLTPVI